MTNTTTTITATEILNELDRLDIPATVQHSGGGCATIYGPRTLDPENEVSERSVFLIGPGSYHWDGPGASRFSFDELFVGPDDDGETTPTAVHDLTELTTAVVRTYADYLNTHETPAEALLNDPTVRARVDDNTLRYLSIVEANESALPVIECIDAANDHGRNVHPNDPSPWDIVAELDETSGDPVSENSGRPEWLNLVITDDISDVWLRALSTELPKIREHLAPTPTLVDRIVDALPGTRTDIGAYYPHEDSALVPVGNAGHIIITRETGTDRYEVGIYTPAAELVNDTLYPIHETLIVDYVVRLTLSGVSGDAWAAWAADTLDDATTPVDAPTPTTDTRSPTMAEILARLTEGNRIIREALADLDAIT